MNTSNNSFKKWNRYVPWLLLAGYLSIVLAVVGDYGLTWDEGLGHFFYGERYLEFFITGDSEHLDFSKRSLAYYTQSETHPDFFVQPRQPPETLWPLPPTLSALSCWLLHRKLGLFDPFDAHHLSNFAFCIFFILLFFYCTGFSPESFLPSLLYSQLLYC